MSTPRVQKSLRFKPEHAATLNEMAERDGISFQEVIDRMVEDSFSIFKAELEKLKKESAEQLEALQTALQADFQAQKDELSLETQRLIGKIDEQTEILEGLSGQIDELTSAYDEKSRTIDDLKTNHLNIPFTEEQREVIQEIWQVLQDKEVDEEWQTPVHLIFDAVVFAFKEWNEVPYNKETIEEIFEYPPALQGPNGETDTNADDSTTDDDTDSDDENDDGPAD